jgi:uncharacterized membrane protein
MATDIQDKFGEILGSDGARQLANFALDEAFKAVGERRSKSSGGNAVKSLAKKLPKAAAKVPGGAGLAAGAGAAALAPVAFKGIGKLIKGDGAGKLTDAPKNLVKGAASKVGDGVGDKVTSKIDEAGGPSGMLKDAVKGALPFGGGGGDGDGGSTKNNTQGAGKGRRMPIQQSIDVAVPVETAYNQWTQYEEWPKFMHRVTRVTQEDPCTVSFAAKIWGKTKEFKADIETQRPDERIKWKVAEGITHTGVVTFHELAPRLTRIELELDVDPGSLLEKAARGMRHIKRAARGDLHRFKAFIEMLENETGAWRGVIEGGEVVEDHPKDYDKQRDYASADELLPDADDDDDEEDEEDKEDKESTRSQSRGSSSRGSARSSSGGSRSSSRSSRGGSSNGSGSSGSSRSSGRSSRASANGGSGGSSRSSSGSSRSRTSASRSGSGRSSSASSRSSGSSRTTSGSSGRSGRSSSGSSRSSGGSGRSSSGSSRSSSGSSRSSGGSGRSSSGSSRSSGGSGRSSSGSSRGSGSSGSSRSGSSRSGSGSGRSRGTSSRGSGSKSSSRSSAAHQGRQRSRSSASRS